MSADGGCNLAFFTLVGGRGNANRGPQGNSTSWAQGVPIEDPMIRSINGPEDCGKLNTNTNTNMTF